MEAIKNKTQVIGSGEVWLQMKKCRFKEISSREEHREEQPTI